MMKHRPRAALTLVRVGLPLLLASSFIACTADLGGDGTDLDSGAPEGSGGSGEGGATGLGGATGATGTGGHAGVGGAAGTGGATTGPGGSPGGLGVGVDFRVVIRFPRRLDIAATAERDDGGEAQSCNQSRHDPFLTQAGACVIM